MDQIPLSLDSIFSILSSSCTILFHWTHLCSHIIMIHDFVRSSGMKNSEVQIDIRLLNHVNMHFFFLMLVLNIPYHPSDSFLDFLSSFSWEKTYYTTLPPNSNLFNTYLAELWYIERSTDEKLRSSMQKDTFDGSRKDINAAIDRISEYTGMNHLLSHICWCKINFNTDQPTFMLFCRD